MFHSFMTRHWFAPEAVAIWSDASTVQAWLDVEVALAQSQAELGLIPDEVVGAIATACRSERLDFARLSADIAIRSSDRKEQAPIVRERLLETLSLGAR